MERIKRVNGAPDGGTRRELDESRECRNRSQSARNKVTSSLAIAMLLAAERVGEDGRGRNGVVGYFTWIARTQPLAFFRLLVRVCLDQNVGEGHEKPQVERYETLEEVIQEARECGIDGSDGVDDKHCR
jgi:hypothetical protein